MKIAKGHGGLGRLCLGFLLTTHVVSAQWSSYRCGPRCEQIKAWIEDILNQLDTASGDLESIIPFIDGTTPEDLDPEDPPQSPTVLPSTTLTSVSPIYPPEGTISSEPIATSEPSVVRPPNSSASAMPPYAPSSGYRSVAYFTNWGIYGRGYTPDKIPAESLTHILYAFADNREDGTVFLTDSWSDIDKHYEGDSWNDVGNNLYGNLKQLNLLKRRNRNLKILLSIGGWTYTNIQRHMDVPASTAQGRRRFADGCVHLLKELGLDGIDVDWEYPQSPEQGEHLLLLLQEIRSAMDQYAEHLVQSHPSDETPHFILSIAAPAGRSNYENYPLERIAETLDFINLMAYDYAGSWERSAAHQANLFKSTSNPASTPFDTESVIEDYTAAGIPSDKIVLGMPLYGRSFLGTDGLGEPYAGVGGGDWENGIWDYKNLPKEGAEVMYDEEAGATYSYDNNSRTIISYDTPQMAARKAQYIQQKNLGGAMWWELSGDSEDSSRNLINTVLRTLGARNASAFEVANNWIYYPDSTYENVKNGFPDN